MNRFARKARSNKNFFKSLPLLVIITCQSCVSPKTVENPPSPQIQNKAPQYNKKNSNDEIQNIVQTIDQDRLKKHVQKLTQIGSRLRKRPVAFRELNQANYNPNAQTQKMIYIKNKLQSYGYKVQYEKGFGRIDLPGMKPVNLVVTKKGTQKSRDVIELGAHYDTMANPGADDNASGVAGVLEVARALSKIKLKRTVRMIFYDLEELGMIGSEHHVKKIKQQRNEKFAGAYVFEMIGFSDKTPNSQRSPVRIPHVFDPPTTGDFIALMADRKSHQLRINFENVSKKYVKSLKFYGTSIAGKIPDAYRSDHASYWRAGFKAIMITDTANFRNKNYHQKTDTIQTLDFEFMTRVVQAMTATLITYAQPAETTPSRINIQ